MHHFKLNKEIQIELNQKDMSFVVLMLIYKIFYIHICIIISQKINYDIYIYIYIYVYSNNNNNNKKKNKT